MVAPRAGHLMARTPSAAASNREAAPATFIAAFLSFAAFPPACSAAAQRRGAVRLSLGAWAPQRLALH